MRSISFDAASCSKAWGPWNWSLLSMAARPRLAFSSSKCLRPSSSLSGNRSARATTWAEVLLEKDSATEVPRLPQPSRPWRTAELAAYPKAVRGLSRSMPEPARAPDWMSWRRSMVSLFLGISDKVDSLLNCGLRSGKNFVEDVFKVDLFLADVL